MNAPPERTRRPLMLSEAHALLSRTPALLDAWLRDLPDGWLAAHEGGETWNPVGVVAHLIQGERTNWMPRVRHILEHGETTPFATFQRVGDAHGSLSELLDAFARLRRDNLRELEMRVDDGLLGCLGTHPALGSVSLRNLLSAWVVHDLDHITQIARVLATQYTDEIGAWRDYLRIISGRQG